MNHTPVISIKHFRQSASIIMLFGLFLSSIIYADDSEPVIAFVGASFTAGSGENGLTFYPPASEYFRKLRYSNFSIDLKNFSPVKDSIGLFGVMADPVGQLSQQVREASKLNPKFIVGVDMLFWLIYSEVPAKDKGNEERVRLGRLEQFLETMDKSGQNYVVSQLPKVAVDLKLPFLGNYKYEVSESTVKKANKMLSEWSQRQNESFLGKGKILLLDLNDYFTHSTLYCGSDLGKRPKNDVMSADRLHPSELGHICLAGRLLDELSKSQLSQFNFISSYFDQTELHAYALKGEL